MSLNQSFMSFEASERTVPDEHFIGGVEYFKQKLWNQRIT